MERALLSDKESPLINYAIRKLDPEVFSHPVWVRFNTELSDSNFIIDELLKATKSLQASDSNSACQILLLCAAIRSCAGEYGTALQMTKQALSIAEHSNIAQGKVWAGWGAAAICFQWGNLSETAKYLAYLQRELITQGDWILANFVDIVRQSLPNPDTENQAYPSAPSSDKAQDNLLITIFDWFRQWGFLFPSIEMVPDLLPGYAMMNSRVPPALNHSFLPATRLQSFGHKFLFTIREMFTAHSISHNLKSRQRWFPLLESLFSRWHYHRIKVASQTPGELRPSIESSTLIQDVEKHNRESQFPEADFSFTSEQVNGNDIVVPVVVQMLGTFSLTIQDLSLKLPGSRALSLLKYLLLHHKQDTPRDILMEIFWPEAGAEAARNNLNVAMHSLRHALRSVTDVPVIRFANGAYGLAANLDLWLDVEEFEHCVKEGQRLERLNQPAAAMTEYEIAINLYQGDFLSDNPYENWTILDRERLRVSYLDTLDHLSQIYFTQEHYAACVNLCQLILARDICREDAHCRLMQCYSRLGQGPLALRQYQVCVEALQAELDVEPAPETKKLYEYIRRRKHV